MPSSRYESSANVAAEKHAEICLQWSGAPYANRAEAFGGGVFTDEERDAFLDLEPSKWAVAEGHFRQLNDLSRVQQHIPSSMLGTIEVKNNPMQEKAAAVSQMKGRVRAR